MKILTCLSISFITTSTTTSPSTTRTNAFLLNNNYNYNYSNRRSTSSSGNNRIYSIRNDCGVSSASSVSRANHCVSHGQGRGSGPGPIPFLMGRRRTLLSFHSGSGGDGYINSSDSSRGTNHHFDRSTRRRRHDIIALQQQKQKQQEQQDELEDVIKTTKISEKKADDDADVNIDTDTDVEITSAKNTKVEKKEKETIKSSSSLSSPKEEQIKPTATTSNKSKGGNKKGEKNASSNNSKEKTTMIQKEGQDNEKDEDKEKDDKKTATAMHKKELKSISARYVYDNDLYLTTDEEGRLTARPAVVDGEEKVSLDSSNTPVDVDSDDNDNGNDIDIVKGKKNENKDKRKKSQESKSKNQSQSKEIKSRTDHEGDKDGDSIVKGKEISNSKSKANTVEGTKKEKKDKEESFNSVTTKSKVKNKDQNRDSPIQSPSTKSSPILPQIQSSPKTSTSAAAAVATTAVAASTTITKVKSEKIKSERTQPKTIKIPGITIPTRKVKLLTEDVPKPVISGGFNVVLTHCTADFDSLASAVGLAKLWSTSHPSEATATSISSASSSSKSKKAAYESASLLPTFVVLPRGAHPSVQRFLALHKHLFPIRSLRSLPNDLSKLNRLGLVDAQRRDRVGPAEVLIGNADRVTIIDHHIDGTSDIHEATDYVIDEVGSVSTMVAEQLRDGGFELTEAEATLLALGIHADTGSLCFDSTTTRDAEALAWVMKQGASQAAIAENAHASLSREQQGVLTNALINTNSTVVHGVTVSTVLLSADGFINGLAAVTQDALELSSSDVFLLAVVYDPKSGGRGKGKGKGKHELGVRLQSKLFKADKKDRRKKFVMEAEAWKGGEKALKLRRLKDAFDDKDVDGSGYLDEDEILKALTKSGVIASTSALEALMSQIDTDGNGKIDFDEFVAFSDKAEKIQVDQERKAATMIVIGRVKAGVNMKHVNLNRLFQQFGGGGHAKAASCTVRLEDESNAGTVLQGIVDELIETGLMQQPTVGDFMTSPVLSAKPTMTEKQVEDLFVRYDVRALPVVDDKNDVVGLVTYKEVASAKQRLWNKEQKRIRQEAKRAASDNGKKKKSDSPATDERKVHERKLGSALKGWMKQHVKTVEASMTMAEVENILLSNDVGCIPVVADGTTQLVGMVTRTDLLRQHRYYPSLHYNNKGFADSIAARKPIIELRKKLKQFDLEED